MKKTLLPFLLAAVLASCGETGENEPPEPDYVTRADMEGVSLIYFVPDDGGTGNRLMTVDGEGNVEPFRFITDQGNRVPSDTTGIRIYSGSRVGNDYMVLTGEFEIKDGQCDNLLVNIRTGELTVSPSTFVAVFPQMPVFTDDSGKVYLMANNNGQSGIFFFDFTYPDQPSVSMLSDGSSSVDGYWVNSDGICFYRSGLVYSISLLYAGIHNVSGLLPGDNDRDVTLFFGRNQKPYIAACSVDNMHLSIYEVSYEQEGSLEEGNLGWSFPPDMVEVARLDNQPIGPLGSSTFCPIPQTGKHIFSSQHAGLIVFDEEDETLTQEPDAGLPELDMLQIVVINALVSSGALWINGNGGQLSRMTASGGYAAQPVDLSGEGYSIDFTEVACLPDHDGLMAPALRSSDGQNVIVRISDTGEVTELEHTATSAEISSLIRLD